MRKTEGGQRREAPCPPSAPCSRWWERQRFAHPTVPPLIMIGVRGDVVACSRQIKVRRDRTNKGEGKPMRLALSALGAVSILLLPATSLAAEMRGVTATE